MRAAVEQLPDAVTAALRGVARSTAARMKASAAAALRRQQKTAAAALADAIEIVEDVPNQQIQVVSKPPRGQPANVTIWNEHGTIKMPARPYMRPSAQAEEGRYRSDMSAAAESAARRLLGND
jgi:hypothetical protein